ncbi:MAG: hypothetical protein EBY94_08985, partial [Burkholderiaceae bacterium]|nr:hypothetical protein [Burkholderiaceae bacterium]
PPMQHRTRGTALDVHHTLVPPTTGLAISGAALLADAKPSAIPGVWVLSDIDQVLHSACHWFYESEYFYKPFLTRRSISVEEMKNPLTFGLQSNELPYLLVRCVILRNRCVKKRLHCITVNSMTRTIPKALRVSLPEPLPYAIQADSL